MKYWWHTAAASQAVLTFLVLPFHSSTGVSTSTEEIDEAVLHAWRNGTVPKRVVDDSVFSDNETKQPPESISSSSSMDTIRAVLNETVAPVSVLVQDDDDDNAGDEVETGAADTEESPKAPLDASENGSAPERTTESTSKDKESIETQINAAVEKEPHPKQETVDTNNSLEGDANVNSASVDAPDDEAAAGVVPPTDGSPKDVSSTDQVKDASDVQPESTATPNTQQETDNPTQEENHNVANETNTGNAIPDPAAVENAASPNQTISNESKDDSTESSTKEAVVEKVDATVNANIATTAETKATKDGETKEDRAGGENEKQIDQEEKLVGHDEEPDKAEDEKQPQEEKPAQEEEKLTGDDKEIVQQQQEKPSGQETEKAKQDEKEKEPKKGSLASFFKKVNDKDKSRRAQAEEAANKEKESNKSEATKEEATKEEPENKETKTATQEVDATIDADKNNNNETKAEVLLQDDKEDPPAEDANATDEAYGYTTIWGRRRKLDSVEKFIMTPPSSDPSEAPDASSSSHAGTGANGGNNDPAKSGATAKTEGNDDETKQQPPSVNAQFVMGLDDIGKFLEEVDPPDELDVGAVGSSLQEVLMGQGTQILRKRVSLLMQRIKQFFVDRTSQDGSFGLIKKEEWDAMGKAARILLKLVMRQVQDLVDGLFNSDDSDDDMDLQFGQEESKLAGIRQKLSRRDTEEEKPTPSSATSLEELLRRSK